MSRVASIVPDESDLLCEGCGYTLKGLPTTGNCPECGKPIEQSLGTHRQLSGFEQHPSIATFLRTFAAALFSPDRFFRHLTTRSKTRESGTFADVHFMLASVLFFLAQMGHMIWVAGMIRIGNPWIDRLLLASWIVGLPIIFCVLRGLTWLAAWLSAIEARYWGMRLPHQVVVRGMRFHSVSYLPVGLLAVTLVWGYRIMTMLGLIYHEYDDAYMYTLCVAVIVSAIYLFYAYWIAMRNMMYANR